MVIDIIYQLPVIDICFVVAAAKTDRNAEFFRMLFYFTVIGVFFVQDKKKLGRIGRNDRTADFSF